ncbi:MAG: site-2 protease family protein [Methanoregula sp.]|nr:site-2 protease family protein [Methanoregula sp.]
MDWIVPLIFLVAAYAVIAYYVHAMKLWEDHIVFYGPIMAIKTNRVQFFDKFVAWRTFFRIYGTIGVIAVIIISVLITVMLFISVRYTLLLQPEPTGIYEPQNILLIPGINQYVPSTIAVWLAFIITIGIHEFGHAILCRVENIKVRGMGALVAVIPIGFFVEPDEEELDKTKGMPKARMFGAGITNNLVFGFSCFVLLILLFGLVVPAQQPVIYGVYRNYSADAAGVPPDSVIRYIAIANTSPARGNQSVVPIPAYGAGLGSFSGVPSTGRGSKMNLTAEKEKYFLGLSDPSPAYSALIDKYLIQRYGERSYRDQNNTVCDPFSCTSSVDTVPATSIDKKGSELTAPSTVRVPVASREQVSIVLNTTKPGDRIILGVEKNDVLKEYSVNLSTWPAEAGSRQSGFMGITYYDGALVKSAVQEMFSPVGFFQFLIVPFATGEGSGFVRIIAFDTPDTRFYQVPFYGFWEVIHLLFWCAWININVGIFNAIPMVPLDGGYIFKEGVDRLLDRRGLSRYSGYVVSAVSYVMVVVLMSLILLPYLMHM